MFDKYLEIILIAILTIGVNEQIFHFLQRL